MQITFWGTRGSVAAPGPDTARYGGNTSCVQVRGADGTVLVLDGGTGIRRLGSEFCDNRDPIHVLLTHLHMDHIQGLGFFAPLYHPGREVHVWGPASLTMSLWDRLTRYLSPPLFPVLMRELPCDLRLHETPGEEFNLGEFRITTGLVCHPGPTVGYRIASPNAVLTYIPDHEPAMGAQRYPLAGEWTSGFSLADKADLLIHDAQYFAGEYDSRVGWGHSALTDAITFAALAGVRHLAAFHHDPVHDDDTLERLLEEGLSRESVGFKISLAAEGETVCLPAPRD